MEASRLNEMKTPQHLKTPRSRRHFRNCASPYSCWIIFFERPVSAPYMRSFKRQVFTMGSQTMSKGASASHAVSIARDSQDV